MQFITGSQFGIDAAAVGEISCFGSSNPEQYYRRMWYAMQFDSILAAESTMDVSSSPENFDSKKRPLELEHENGVIKRTHSSSSGDGQDQVAYHFKLLIPSTTAGAIIGKGGETIAHLQREKKAKIKMSKANDYYPGTTERVCIISSSVPESIMAVLVFIMEKIREKPEQTKPVHAEVNSEREKQVKILVPNTTAGMIIGKGGSYIKQIKEHTGAYVQLSQKPKDISLPERCITVSGDIEINTKACRMILQKIVEDPQSGSCPNLSYADVVGPVANFNPTGSPYAATKSVNGVFAGGGESNVQTPNVLNVCITLPNSTNGVDTAVAAKYVENFALTLHSSGFAEPALSEITAALTVLARYGMLGIGYGLSNGVNSAVQSTKPVSNLIGTNTIDLSTLAAAAAANNLYSATATALSPQNSFDLSLGSTTTATLDIFHPGQLSIATNNNCLGLFQTNDFVMDFSNATDIKNVDIEVNEAMLANILGPNGTTLLEIQYRSGALVQISKKSLFLNSSSNRIISVSGTSASVAAAQVLIEQKMNESVAKMAATTMKADVGLE